MQNAHCQKRWQKYSPAGCPTLFAYPGFPSGLSSKPSLLKKHCELYFVAANDCIQIRICMASQRTMNAEVPPIQMLHPILPTKEARCSPIPRANASNSPGRLRMPRSNSAKSSSSTPESEPTPSLDGAARTITPSSNSSPDAANTLALAQAGDHHAFAQL